MAAQVFGNTHPVAFQGFCGVFLLLPKAVRALGFMEYVWGELPALRHGAREKTFATINMSTVLFKIGDTHDRTIVHFHNNTSSSRRGPARTHAHSLTPKSHFELRNEKLTDSSITMNDLTSTTHQHPTAEAAGR